MSECDRVCVGDGSSALDQSSKASSSLCRADLSLGLRARLTFGNYFQMISG